MSADPELLAQGAVDDVLLKANNGAAACAILMRLAGQALARLSDHDQAASIHAQLARKHAMRAARRWRP
jgi:hypothetical protein